MNEWHRMKPDLGVIHPITYDEVRTHRQRVADKLAELDRDRNVLLAMLEADDSYLNQADGGRV